MLGAAMVAFFSLALGVALGLLARMIWRGREAIVAALRGRWPGLPLSAAEEEIVRQAMEGSAIGRKILGERDG